MLRLVAAWYCAILLWMSGTQHVANKFVFFATVLDYRLVSTSLASLIAGVLPWLHLMLAAVLIAPGIRSKAPFLAATFLGLAFVAVQSTVLIRGIPVDCGCFGAMVERPVGVASLTLAGSLAVVGLVGGLLTSPSLVPRVVSRRAQQPEGTDPGAVERNASPMDTSARASESAAAGISIIMPVFNEFKTIDEVVEKLHDVANNCAWDWELLIVNDGSTDGTAERLQHFCNLDRVRVITHDTNRGKGAAIRTALGLASRDLTVIQDADLEYNPRQIDELISEMHRQQADVVYGSRILGAKAGLAESRRNIYAVGVSVLNFAVRILYGLRVTDEATCYKLFRTDDLRRMELTCQGFEFCPEVTAKAARLGLSIIEIPISYRPRSTSEGKKIRFRDAVCAIQTLWRFRRWTSGTPQAG